MKLIHARWMLVSAVLVIACGAFSASASARTYVVTDCTGSKYKHPEYKPKKISVPCSPTLRILHKLRWYRWGGKAKARGRYAYQTCEPNCIDGKVRRRRARVVLYRKRYCGYSTKRVYTRMIIIARGEPRDPMKIPCRPPNG